MISRKLLLSLVWLLWAMPLSTADATDDECGDAADCEAPAPYILQIITSGEGEPRSSNDSEEGLQDNRRADVTLTREVSDDNPVREVRSAKLDTGGTVWVSQDPTSLTRSLTATSPKNVPVADGKAISSVTFEVINNYASFIDRLELLIWEGSASLSNETLLVKKLNPSLYWQSWDWDAVLPDLEPGRQIRYAVRAYDSEGHVDQTARESLVFTHESESDSNSIELPGFVFSDEIGDAENVQASLERESIPVRGSKVRVLGQDLEPGATVQVNNLPIVVDNDGRFGLELLLPDGRHEIDFESADDEGATQSKQLSVDLDSNYLFMVGLADLTIGDNNVTGSLEPLAVDEHHYGGNIFVDGRLAFYLKGKVKGKYLVTAQMDTGTDDIENLFDDFHRKDPRSIFRRLDPDQYYPVYGDDSQLIDDTDSQGKLYVRVDWDRSRAIWGNFNTNFNDTEFAPFNRSLYGGQLNYRSTKDTELGDADHRLSLFASRAQSLFRHNEFLGTGGSLYYLRDSDIVSGSEKVWVEVRQTDTERVVERIPLVEGRDYDIDDFQGRIILRRPLLSVTAQSGPSIIRDEPLSGNETYLVVDYEYSPVSVDFDDVSVGARGKKWFGDHVGVGGTWVNENREGSDYSIMGTDVTVKKSDRTYIKGEFAQSESLQTSGSFISTDGGLSFDSVQNTSGDNTGNAIGIEARAALTDFRASSTELDVALWTKLREAGFSTANTDVDVDTTDMGFEVIASPHDRIGLSARATRVDREGESVETMLAGQVDYLATDRLTLSGEVNRSSETNRVNDTRGSATTIAAKSAYDITDDLNIYGISQVTASRTGSHTRNNSNALGAIYSFNNNINLTGEVSTGDRGDSALFGAEVGFSDTYSVYTNYTYSLNSEMFEKNTLVVGQRKTLSSQLKVYSEHQFSDEDSRDSYAHTIGFDQKLTQYTTLGFSGQVASIENEDDTQVDRNTLSAGLAYQRDNKRFNSKLEYREDEGAGVDIRQWVTTNRFEYRRSASLRWQGQFNASVTDDRIGVDDARFIEGGIGFAYRPVFNDRLNMLGRLTYLNDLQPLSQTTESDQRSLISSIEALYDLTRFWSVGGKLAHRGSEIRLERNAGDWIRNDASLAAARVRYKANFGIDATAAYHWLSSRETDSLRHGALLTIGRRVGDNLTFAVGYNFTSFDDNLGNDSYDVRGWFVNLIGTY